MSIQRSVANTLKNPAVIHYRVENNTTIYFASTHVSGNVDVFYNGILMLPEIGDSLGVQTNFTSTYFDYQSGTADNIIGVNWVPATTIGQICTYVKFAFTLTADDIVSIRSY